MPDFIDLGDEQIAAIAGALRDRDAIRTCPTCGLLTAGPICATCAHQTPGRSTAGPTP